MWTTLFNCGYIVNKVITLTLFGILVNISQSYPHVFHSANQLFHSANQLFHGANEVFHGANKI